MTSGCERAGPKVFIAGAPRSGTSILLFAIKSVFDLPGYGESHVIPAFSQMVHALYTYMDEFRKVDHAVFNETMLSQVSLPDVREHLYAYIRDLYARTYPTGSWVDKTPSPPGVFGLAMAEKVFPDARLIAIQRNGIEVVSSYMKKFNSTIEPACNMWRSTMEGIDTIRPLCKNLLVVDQYDFCNAPHEVSLSLASHVGLPAKANALSRFLAGERVERSSTHDWTKRLRLTETSWDAEQRAVFQTRCGTLMKELGYDI
jgi:hypothetical protein